MKTPEELATIAWHHYRKGVDAIREAINEAVEAAAQTAEERGQNEIAASIRTLKTSSPPRD